MRRLHWLVIATLCLLTIGAPSAMADNASDVVVDVVVEADGSLQVTQTVTGAADGFTQIIPKRRAIDSSSYYMYEIADVAATAGSGSVDVSTEATATHVEVTVAGSSEPITLRYRVDGATHTEQGQQGELTVAQWPVLAGLSLGVDKVSGSVEGPGQPQLIDCESGPRDSVGKCALIAGGTFEQPEPAFQDGNRAAGDEVVLTVGYERAAVAPTASIGESWSLDRAFDASWPSLLWALLGALAGGGLLYLLHRRTGRDLAHDGATPVGSFAPTAAGESVFVVPQGIRPGHVGTVADESVDPIDVTATLIDLAVRGHLRITELPRTQHGLLDWRLERLSGQGDLAEFERELLDAVAPEGVPCLVSELPSRLAGKIERVQDALYEDVVARGWFESRPDSTRHSWRSRGIVLLALAGIVATALILFTKLGFLALVLLALAAVFILIADRMPRRTAAGSSLVVGLQALAALLATHPTDQVPRGREVEEISKLLGYTVVLGGKERWLAALIDADEDDTAPDPTTVDWYHAPDTWHLQDLPASLTQFVHTVQGELFGR